MNKGEIEKLNLELLEVKILYNAVGDSARKLSTKYSNANMVIIANATKFRIFLYLSYKRWIGKIKRSNECKDSNGKMNDRGQWTQTVESQKSRSAWKTIGRKYEFRWLLIISEEEMLVPLNWTRSIANGRESPLTMKMLLPIFREVA